jgi:hypothetical protein
MRSRSFWESSTSMIVLFFSTLKGSPAVMKCQMAMNDQPPYR